MPILITLKVIPDLNIVLGIVTVVVVAAPALVPVTVALYPESE